MSLFKGGDNDINNGSSGGGLMLKQRSGSAETDPGQLNRAISHPGSVKINVEGAFIVEDEPRLTNGNSEGVHYERKDIRLPHHTGVVSHVAVDVSRGRNTTTYQR